MVAWHASMVYFPHFILGAFFSFSKKSFIFGLSLRIIGVRGVQFICFLGID